MEKNKVWLWRAIDGVSRASLGVELGDRSDSCCRKLIERVDTGKCTFITDDWAGFKRILPAERHFTGKDLTFPIEATNSDIRHRLARFHRRSKVTTRSKEMVQPSLTLFEHFKDPDNLQKALKSFLAFFS